LLLLGTTSIRRRDSFVPMISRRWSLESKVQRVKRAWALTFCLAVTVLCYRQGILGVLVRGCELCLHPASPHHGWRTNHERPRKGEGCMKSHEASHKPFDNRARSLARELLLGSCRHVRARSSSRRKSFGATCGILRWMKVGLIDVDTSCNLPSLVVTAKLVASAILIDE
jgi:hypothetical protein